MTKEDASRATLIAQYILVHEGVLESELNMALFNNPQIDVRSLMGQVNNEFKSRVFIMKDMSGTVSISQTGIDILENGGFEKYLKNVDSVSANKVIVNGDNNGNIVAENGHSPFFFNRPNIVSHAVVKRQEKNTINKTSQQGTGLERSSIKDWIQSNWVVTIVGGLIVGVGSYLIVHYLF